MVGSRTERSPVLEPVPLGTLERHLNEPRELTIPVIPLRALVKAAENGGLCPITRTWQKLRIKGVEINGKKLKR
jgi:hypothetical protein